MGLVAMLVAGARAGDSWGFLLADPPCIRAGECRWDQLPQRQADAWPTLVPGAFASAAGLVLLLLAAALEGPPGRPEPRSGAARSGVLAGAATAGLGAVCVLPLAMSAVVSPPMGAAGLCTVAVLLGTVVARLARSALPWSRAAPVALVAVLGGLGLAAAVGSVAWRAGGHGLTLLVAPAVALPLAVGAVTGLGVRAVGRRVSAAGPTVGG